MRNISFLLFILSILSPSILCAQTGSFKIKGSVKGNYEGETVLIDVLKEKGFPQSYIGTVRDNAFLIEIEDCNTCDTLAKIKIGNSPNKEFIIWLDSKDILVDVDNEKVRIEGTNLNDRYQEYRDTSDYYSEKLAPLFSQINGKTSFTLESKSNEYNLFWNWGKFEYDFLKANIHNSIGVFLFSKELANTFPVMAYKGDQAFIDIYDLADDWKKR